MQSFFYDFMIFLVKTKKVYFIGLILLFCSCNSKNVKTKYFDKKQSITKYSKYLTIYEKEEGVYIHITHPEIKNKTYRYFIPSNKQTNSTNYQKIKTPINSMIVFSSTHIGMLSELNKTEVIKGVVSKKYVHNKNVIKGIENKRIIEFGEENQPSFEKIISSKAKLIMYSGFTDDFPKSKHLRKLGIHCIPNFDWKEAHPLGKVEWMLFFGYLTGTEKKAKKYVKKVKQKYNHLKNIASKSKTSKTVFSGNLYGENWFAPGGKSFKATLFKDAKCEYRYQKNRKKGSISMRFEKILIDNKNTNYWFNPGFKNKKLILQNNPKSIHFESFKNNNVFCYSHDKNKFWEISACHPDYVLADLIQILHPEINLNRDLYFYKNINEK